MSASQITYIFGIQNHGIILSYDPVEQILQPSVHQSPKINSWSSVVGVTPDEIYITGGLNQTGKIISNEAFIYQPQTQQIQELPPMNQVRYVHTSIFKDDKLFVLGGRQYGPDFESVLSHCEVYQKGVWRNIAPMSKRRSNFCSFVYKDRIHVLGGFDGRKHSKTIEYYDENKNIWQRKQISLTRGLAGMHIMNYKPHQIIVIGGITQQGPTSSCLILDLELEQIQTIGSILEQRTLPLMTQHEDKIVIFGGNYKFQDAEEMIIGSFESTPLQIKINIEDEQLLTKVSSSLRGFAVSNPSVYVSSNFVGQVNKHDENAQAEDYCLLVGNDDFSFIYAINKNINDQGISDVLCEEINFLPIPYQLQLLSYMSYCLVSNENQIKTIFLGGGIDSRITSISKKCYLVQIDLKYKTVSCKILQKMQYHRYASSCVFKYPYIYVIGGRGYQNDILSLHNTVERYNIEEEQWEQVPPISEAKCSATANLINDRIYLFGGYIGDSKISDRIEVLNDGFLQWSVLNVKLPFALEGLSSINSNENEVLIIGGKGSNGSRKEILRYKSKELDDDYPTYGQIIGEMEHCRSLPKIFMTSQNDLLIFGGKFYDNPQISFYEVIDLLQMEQKNQQSDCTITQTLEKLSYKLGGPEQLGMFSLIQY